MWDKICVHMCVYCVLQFVCLYLLSINKELKQTGVREVIRVHLYNLYSFLHGGLNRHLHRGIDSRPLKDEIEANATERSKN